MMDWIKRAYDRILSFFRRGYSAQNLQGAYSLHRPNNHSGCVEVMAASAAVRARVRDAERNNPLISGLIFKNATMVIGDEIGFKPLIIDDGGQPKTLTNNYLERRFAKWAESASVEGYSLTEVAQFIENHLLLDGEVLIRRCFVENRQQNNPFRLQVLESDHLDSGATIYQGIEYDSYGRPIAYWIYPRHPGGPEYNSLESVRVPAEEICFIAEVTRASQRRGISRLAPALQKLYGVDDLEDAEMIASRSAAAFGIILETDLPDSMTWNPYTGADGSSIDSPTDANGNKLEYLGSGGIVKLRPGEKATSFRSERPNSNFDAFIRGRQRIATHCAGYSYETGTGDYSQVNYSSARMGRVIEWNVIRRRQARIKNRFLNWVYKSWLKYEIALFGVPGINIVDYARNPEKYEEISWQLAGNDSIDPKKEIDTLMAEIMLGTNSRTRFAAERGRDFPQVAKELAEEKKLLESLGIYSVPHSLKDSNLQSWNEPI